MFEALKRTFSGARAGTEKERGAAPKARRSSGGSASRAASPLLFDDEFQRKLESLALVSRRVFAGRMRAERRSKKKGSGSSLPITVPTCRATTSASSIGTCTAALASSWCGCSRKKRI
jgi:hypothetical protein